MAWFALHLSWGKIAKISKRLPKHSKSVCTCCRGPYCPLGYMGVPSTRPQTLAAIHPLVAPSSEASKPRPGDSLTRRSRRCCRGCQHVGGAWIAAARPPGIRCHCRRRRVGAPRPAAPGSRCRKHCLGGPSCLAAAPRT